MKRTAIALVTVVLLFCIWALYASFQGKKETVIPGPVATSTQPVSTSTDSLPVVSPANPAKPIVPPPSGPVTHPYGSVTLSIGQSAQFEGVTITPVSITEDSRCPVGVLCIQAGTVSVSVRITSPSGTATETLSLGKAFTAPAGTITLTSATPAKRADSAIAASEYRLTFDVEKRVGATCYIGGCSSEVCSDNPGAVSSCIYTAAYGCYRSATCERQASGQCGWTQTPELKACLANPPQ